MVRWWHLTQLHSVSFQIMVIYPLLVSFLLHSTLGNTVTSYKQREREREKKTSSSLPLPHTYHCFVQGFDRIAGPEDSSGDGCQVSSWLISFPCILPLCWQGAEGATLSMVCSRRSWGQQASGSANLWLTVWSCLFQPQSLLIWRSWSTLPKCSPICTPPPLSQEVFWPFSVPV